jgi:hypothetical protein
MKSSIVPVALIIYAATQADAQDQSKGSAAPEAAGRQANTQTRKSAAPVAVIARPGGLAPQRTSDVVTVQATSALSARAFGNCVAFDRLGTPPTVAPFKIAAGNAFVMTSVDWIASLPSRASKSVVAYFFIAVAGGTNGPAATGVAVADSEGVVGGTVVFPTGVIVRANQQLCVAVSTVANSNKYAPADAVAQGFFAADSQ